MKIQAATRLKAEYADVDAAKEFIRSTCGLKVGKLNGRARGLISFNMSAAVVPEVVKRLNKKFNTYAPGEQEHIAYEWKVGLGRLIQISRLGNSFVIILRQKGST